MYDMLGLVVVDPLKRKIIKILKKYLYYKINFTMELIVITIFHTNDMILMVYGV
jgi:hypothetical protein